MKYQITDLNDYGNARIFAVETSSVFCSENVEMVGVSAQEGMGDAGAYRICFEITR